MINFYDLPDNISLNLDEHLWAYQVTVCVVLACDCVTYDNYYVNTRDYKKNHCMSLNPTLCSL